MRTLYNDRGGFGMNLSITPGVKALVFANIGVFLLSTFFPALNAWFGLTPSLVLHGFIWQLVTYLFLHAGVGHILFNMLSLWMFGSVLEGTWGRARFMRYYFICGVGAGVCVLIASYLFGGPLSRMTITIGASGAIYGLLLAFGVMYPNAPILVFFLFPVPAKYFVIIMGAIAFYMEATGAGGGVSNVAHLGGLLVGLIYMRSAGFLRPRPSYGYSRPSDFSIAGLRARYEDWNRRRMRKKFEVYMKDRDRNDRVN